MNITVVRQTRYTITSLSRIRLDLTVIITSPRLIYYHGYGGDRGRHLNDHLFDDGTYGAYRDDKLTASSI